MGGGTRSLSAALPVPPAEPAFAPSRPWMHVSEVLFAWWGYAPDLVLAPGPFKPVDRCRVPCVSPCLLTCPGRVLPAATSAACRASGGRGRARAEGAALDLSKEHLRTQALEALGQMRLPGLD
jgi:hypothetical protein